MESADSTKKTYKQGSAFFLHDAAYHINPSAIRKLPDLHKALNGSLHGIPGPVNQLADIRQDNRTHTHRARLQGTV